MLPLVNRHDSTFVMKRAMKLRPIGFGSAVPLLLVLGQGPSQPPTPATPTPTIQPPPQCWPVQARLRPEAHAAHGLQSTVQVDTALRRLTIDWGWEDSSGSTGRSSQAFDLAFWPTAARDFQGDLVVAGIRPSDGHTVIERWSIDYPAPGFAGSDYAGTVSGAQSLYDARVAGRSGVRFLHRLKRAGQASTCLLVQFADSNDLFVLEVASGNLKLLWDSSSVPHLADDRWQYISSAEHSTHGYVYTWGATVEASVIETLVALDPDRDGTIDSWLFLDDQAWLSTLETGPNVWIQYFDL